MAGNVVRILALLDDKVSSGLDRIQGKFGSLTNTKGFKSFAQGMGMGAGISTWNLVGTAVKGVTDAFFGSISAASDLNETINKSKVVFGAASGDMEKFGKRAAESIGLSENAAISAAASIGNLLLSTGTAPAKVEPMSEAIVKLAGDLASFNNIGTDEALAKLQSGLVGQERPLRELGVAISAASVDAEALALGFSKVNGEFTEGQKVQARYSLIFKQTKTAQGDFANTSTALANSQRIANAEWENASATLGQAFTPAATEATHAAAGLAVATADLFKAVGGGTRDSIQSLEEQVALYQRQGASLENINKLYEDVTAAEKDAANNPFLMQDQQASLDRSVYALNQLRASAGQVRDNFGALTPTIDKTSGAVNRSSVAVEDYAIHWEHSAASAKKAFDDMTAELMKDTSTLINEVYDPIIERDKLSANSAEAAAARKILASSKSSAAERRDARDTLHQLAKDNTDLYVQLLESGDITKKEYATLLDSLRKKSRSATGDAKKDINELIAEVKRLYGVLIAGPTVHIEVGLRKTTRKRARQHGGPVEPYEAYTVGEGGKPETLVMGDRAGFVIPGKATTGGQTLIVNFNSIWPPTAQQVRDVANLLDRHEYWRGLDSGASGNRT